MGVIIILHGVLEATLHNASLCATVRSLLREETLFANVLQESQLSDH